MSDKPVIWRTPMRIFTPLHNEFNFTIDLCADAENAKVAHSSYRPRTPCAKTGAAQAWHFLTLHTAEALKAGHGKLSTNQRAVLRMAYKDQGEMVKAVRKLMPHAVYVLGARCLNADDEARAEGNRKMAARDEKKKAVTS